MEFEEQGMIVGGGEVKKDLTRALICDIKFSINCNPYILKVSVLKDFLCFIFSV